MKLPDYRMIAWHVRQAMNEARGGHQSFNEIQTARWWSPAEDEAWVHALDQIITDANSMLADLKAARSAVEKKDAA